MNSATAMIALPTHHWQIAWITNSSSQVSQSEKSAPHPVSSSMPRERPGESSHRSVVPAIAIAQTTR